MDIKYIDGERITIDGVLYKRMKTVKGVYDKERKSLYMKQYRRMQRLRNK